VSVALRWLAVRRRWMTVERTPGQQRPSDDETAMRCTIYILVVMVNIVNSQAVPEKASPDLITRVMAVAND
jgi:hypothetical protein